MGASGEKEFVFFGGKVHHNTENWPADTETCRETCDNWLYTKTVEIYNIANNTMREGTHEFINFADGAAVPYMDSFLSTNHQQNKGTTCCEERIRPEEPEILALQRRRDLDHVGW